jgi:hypothetical protein
MPALTTGSPTPSSCSGSRSTRSTTSTSSRRPVDSSRTPIPSPRRSWTTRCLGLAREQLVASTLTRPNPMTHRPSCGCGRPLPQNCGGEIRDRLKIIWQFAEGAEHPPPGGCPRHVALDCSSTATSCKSSPGRCGRAIGGPSTRATIKRTTLRTPWTRTITAAKRWVGSARVTSASGTGKKTRGKMRKAQHDRCLWRDIPRHEERAS